MKIKLEIENDYGLFKANNNEEPDRLKIYDSDGQYMEYIDVSDVITEGMDDLYLPQQIKTLIMLPSGSQDCFTTKGLRL